MYPTRLNLLPPAKRALIQRMIYVQYVKNLWEILIVVLCVSGVLLLSGERILEEQFSHIAATISTISNQQAEKNKTIKAANDVFAETEFLQKHYTLWTPLFVNIASAIPDRVVLTRLSLDEKAKMYMIDGIADRREDLLALQKNLQSLDRIKDVIVPIEALTAKEHISFSISATLR